MVRRKSVAISRTIAAIGIVVLIIAAAIGVYYASTVNPSNSTSSSSSTPSSSSTSSLSLSTSTSSSSPALHDTLTIDDASFPSNNLNVVIPTLTFPNWMEWVEYQPLVSVNVSQEYAGGGYQLLPALALNWTTSSDGLTVTFNLRHGVTFSNGDPFNSYEVWMNMYNVYYAIEPFENVFFFRYPGIFNYNAIEPRTQVIPIINASGLANPTPQALAIMGNQSWPIYTNGPYQIVFHMSVPFAFLPDILDGSPGMIYDAQVALAHGWPNTYGSPAMGYFAQHIIPGTGPYVMTTYVQNGGVTFVQNPTYWGKNLTAAQIRANPLMDPGHVKNVVINYKPDDLARYTDLSTGSVQMAAVESQDWNLIANNPSQYGWASFPASANVVNSIALNTAAYPLNITAVRLAIAHAINYSLIYKNVFHGAVHPYFGPETPGHSQYYDLGGYQQYSYNVTLAKQLLASAHIKSFPTLTFAMPSGYSVLSGIAQVIQSQLSTNLGINMQIQVSSYPAWLNIYGQGYQYDLAHADTLPSMTFEGAPSYGWSDFSPGDNWVTFTSPGGQDWALWQTNATMALNTALGNSNNESAILSLMRQAQADVYNQVPYLFIGVFQYPYGDGSVAWSKSVVSNAYFDPFWSGANTAPVFNTVTFTS